jgi:hypothetical protein
MVEMRTWCAFYASWTSQFTARLPVSNSAARDARKSSIIVFIIVTHVQVAMDADFVLLLKKCCNGFPYYISFKKSCTHNTRFFECFHTLQSYYHLGLRKP